MTSFSPNYKSFQRGKGEYLQKLEKLLTTTYRLNCSEKLFFSFFWHRDNPTDIHNALAGVTKKPGVHIKIISK